MGKRRSSIGCLFWIALILLVLVIVLFNRKTIENVLKNTDFVSLFKKEITTEETPEVQRQVEEPESSDETPKIETPSREESSQENTEDTIVVEIIEPQEKEQTPEKEEPLESENRKLRKSTVYFVDVSQGGTVRLSGHERTVYYADSPLTETIRTLLKGPAPEELNMELLSLIPEETELRSASVKKGTAYLDFNEAFTFNSFGVEGFTAQLSQIVYTATEFSTVDSVQFLIEGKKVEYLGPEGVYIGKPLRRDSFSQ